ncbi:MAG: 50S ribosomal protein L4 [Bacteroidales bacterium]|jgi:large subunit ribosomal protein L4|nr:50S ribosomal protein L4 [Bacteroidales bacterium]
MEVVVKDIQGKDTNKKVVLDETIFGIEPNEHAVYLDVKAILANKRQGTHASKERNMVAGSTKKLKRQKGTGGARAGSANNPMYRGGGRIFGPQPHDYFQKVNKKVKDLARKSVLSSKLKENAIIVVEDFDFEAPKTKEMVKIQENLKINNKNFLIVVPESNKNVYLSSRNLQQVSAVNACDINTYDLLKAKNIVILESSVEEIENNLK